VLVFEHEDDARRVLGVLAKRLGKYGLRLHPEKTRMVEFCRPSKTTRGGSQRERSFAMLGFTHYWGRSRKGRWVVKRKTAKDRFSRALRGIGQWCRKHRHWKVRDQHAVLSRRLRGHYAYYGVMRIPVMPITHSGVMPITDSTLSDHPVGAKRRGCPIMG